MDAPAPPDTVVVGRVIKPHGVRGELVVEVLSDIADRFEPGRRLELVERGGARRPIRVATARGHSGRLLVGLDGIDDRDLAEGLRGAFFEVPAGASPPPPEGAFYYHQLAGCRCTDRRVGELGEVDEVLEDGGGLLLRVLGPKGTLLVPFVHAYLVEADPARKRLLFDLPDGLVETCRSGS